MVTGASTGIGRAVAELLVARGARVAVFGRSAEKLRELASRGERLPADALQVLLDDPSNKRLAHFLISLEVPPLSEAAEQIALAIAERMPRYRKRSSALCERVLAALASLGPARHLGVFCEALRDPLLSIRRFGLVGLIDARRPESEPALLEFLRTNECLGNSVNALSALLGSGSETAITEAASRVIDLATVRGDDFDDEYGGSGLGELGISPAVPGLGFDLYVRVGKALLAKKSFSSIPPGPDPTLSVFRPKADPRASRRAKARTGCASLW